MLQFSLKNLNLFTPSLQPILQKLATVLAIATLAYFLSTVLQSLIRSAARGLGGLAHAYDDIVLRGLRQTYPDPRSQGIVMLAFVVSGYAVCAVVTIGMVMMLRYSLLDGLYHFSSSLWLRELTWAVIFGAFAAALEFRAGQWRRRLRYLRSATSGLAY
jgi:hypothetical protein